VTVGRFVGKGSFQSREGGQVTRGTVARKYEFLRNGEKTRNGETDDGRRGTAVLIRSKPFAPAGPAASSIVGYAGSAANTPLDIPELGAGRGGRLASETPWATGRPHSGNRFTAWRQPPVLLVRRPPTAWGQASTPTGDRGFRGIGAAG